MAESFAVCNKMVREAVIYRRKNLFTFSAKLDGCPGLVEICCREINVGDKNEFYNRVDASSPLDGMSLVRVSITVGCYCLKKRAFVDCIIHRVLKPGEVVCDTLLPDEIIPLETNAIPLGLVAPVRRMSKRWCSEPSRAAQLMLN